MGKKKINDRAKVLNSISRTINRKIHAEKRLKERFGIEYIKIAGAIKAGHYKRLSTDLYSIKYEEYDIYFVKKHGEIKTFLTKEMAEKSFPEVFNPPKKKKKKKNKNKKKEKKKQSQLIPASILFGEEK